MNERTQVGIVGAGPAGLVLGQLLHQRGIDAVVLEARSREYVEQRVRAGVLEQGTVDLMKAMGVGERMERQGLVHTGVELRFAGRGHRIDFADLTGGRAITVYGQQEVVKDLIAARLDFGGELLFEVEDVRPEGIETDTPSLRFRHAGEEHTLECDVIAGCDGFHGVCRDAVPEGALSFHEREWPFAWLGILAEAAPSSDELIYAHHERGFALQSMRSPEVTRLYLQCPPTDEIESWPDERIWEELELRLASGDFHLNQGPIFERGITPMRSFVTEPMQHGRLYLAGDAVHIVPPTGAKGLNLAVADVRVLAEALERWFATGEDDLLRGYSETCLRRVWHTQHFSWWMTSMLHRMPDDVDGFQAKLQIAQLDYVCASRAASQSLAENYVGLDLAS
ncbi:MAG: p-hydroxybenzoate 3-monooxygenase [Thermoleophilaceae bacterium]|nr:p-hydroxybenzoate 3-monooxygenase [Thermoleophilaceae bacterium]MEA2399675.1 p-hydroxybenzoate 3-monooxygenase [Thermoleophilaceae bacterium]MEA2455225.1 p-hydroxybenzoate 3-monooxygenase [Thermoleophilaceae bacterium]